MQQSARFPTSIRSLDSPGPCQQRWGPWRRRPSSPLTSDREPAGEFWGCHAGRLALRRFPPFFAFCICRLFSSPFCSLFRSCKSKVPPGARQNKLPLRKPCALGQSTDAGADWASMAWMPRASPRPLKGRRAEGERPRRGPRLDLPPRSSTGRDQGPPEGGIHPPPTTRGEGAYTLQ